MDKQDDPTFRVLALDGGGVKGTFTAALLAELERMTGKRVGEYFDLITGTSTGGIIAIALAVGIPAEQVRRFYVERGPAIFPSVGIHNRFHHWLRHWVWTKHDPQHLRKALTDVFGERKMGEARTRLVVPAFNIVDGSVTLFKTAHCVRFRQDYLRDCIDVALATSAAPTYLPPTTSVTAGSIWMAESGQTIRSWLGYWRLLPIARKHLPRLTCSI